jgi:hypothetical protein
VISDVLLLVQVGMVSITGGHTGENIPMGHLN